MSRDLFPGVLYLFFVAIVGWLCWRVLVGKTSATDANGNKRPYTRREKLLFVGFLLIGAAAFFFDPFPKQR
jgi:hypothetical protein